MEFNPMNRTTVINITVFLEAFLLLVAMLWGQSVNIPFKAEMHANIRVWIYGAVSGLALASTSMILFWAGKYVHALANLRSIVVDQLAPLFSEITWMDILLLAASSGFCEEVFFRGVAQVKFGLLSTSIIFGLFHCPSFKHFPYGFWAFSAGLFLGWLYQTTGSLWAPILAHGISNAIALFVLRYGIKRSLPPINS